MVCAVVLIQKSKLKTGASDQCHMLLRSPSLSNLLSLNRIFENRLVGCETPCGRRNIRPASGIWFTLGPKAFCGI